METLDKKKTWTDEERLALATKLDAELDEYIDNLEKKKYTEGWSEDKWQEEMDKHPFFMSTAPKPGEELSPLMEGLQQLKYGEDENTPEELANNYKEDGNFNYRHKKYRIAILSYTEGIKTKCKDKELMAQLYNNRAVAHFMLKNYRSSLNDCKLALSLKQEYPKALLRAATCSFHLKDYDQCIELCDKLLAKAATDKDILKLQNDAVLGKACLERDKRKQTRLEKQLNKADEKLLKAVLERGINIQTSNNLKIELSDLDHNESHIPQKRVELDTNNRLLWPVLILYPESMQSDFVQGFHEDTLFLEQLTDILSVPPEWDTKHEYNVENINVYFEGKKELSIHVINVQQTLGKILQDERFTVRHGMPTFLILVKSSKAEERFLKQYNI
ncbi:tetratricopeptide repeat protein 4 isoform X1 [Harpegnathos saltator]|uniref:Tetratricopeptide repeat protein 4 n=1 Tax=Harpegnathos saltator TaxID=610380 RepID=E2BLB6_HARSA|nr:tetratricopeptide repeat protein 4 isoform X1 [Harpegnathos saltator]EFN83468.1 Tetratricopeptide repeat protein 4 [Harpegnathos saltator]